MKVRCVNKVTLIGNVVRQPELRRTGSGISVCNFVIITDREWVTSSGEKRMETTKHNVVAWNKLAEICSELLRQGTLVFLEGSLQSGIAEDPNTKYQVEEVRIVADEMIVLGQKGMQ